MPSEEKQKPGPKPTTVNTDEDFESVVKRALKKKPPKSRESGWDSGEEGQDKPSDDGEIP